jgi:hypothetical protein
LTITAKGITGTVLALASDFVDYFDPLKMADG